MKFLFIIVGALAAPLTFSHHESYFYFRDTQNIGFLLLMLSVLLSTITVVFQRKYMSTKRR